MYYEEVVVDEGVPDYLAAVYIYNILLHVTPENLNHKIFSHSLCSLSEPSEC